MERVLVISVALAACLSPVQAQEHNSQSKTIECYCTDRTGSRVELGQTVCLTINGRAFTALCEMAQNNPIWRDTGQGCLASDAGSLLHRLQQLQPAANAGLVDATI